MLFLKRQSLERAALSPMIARAEIAIFSVLAFIVWQGTRVRVRYLNWQENARKQ